MLKFNTILETSGIDPKGVQLIRHKDTDLPRQIGKTIFDVWFSEREKFKSYQRVQSPRNSFEKKNGRVASFVVTNSNETLFVGMYNVEDLHPARLDEIDPVWRHRFSQGDLIHQMTLSPELSEYVQRLVIRPWNDAINYVKRCAAVNPDILEIKRNPEDEKFPGDLEFIRRVENLNSIFPSWQERLRKLRGVYILTFDDGQQYIGSAAGTDGFWQRWQNYVLNGHGGNVALQNRDARKAFVSILETARSSDRPEQIVAREMIWKKKLGSGAIALDDAQAQQFEG